VNRREFIRAGALSAAAFAASRALAADASGLNGLPTVAVIGLGPQGRGLMHQFLGQKVVVKAVCDCDKVRREDALRRVREHYERNDGLGIPKDACRAEGDFRKIIEDPGIDMVCIATPDHWHAYMVVEAMKHGKDVYCEKPLTYSVDEARVIVEVAKRTGRILQTGAMQRSGFEFLTACEMVRSGMIGKVAYVENQFGGPACPRRPYKDFKKWQEEGAPNPDCDFKMWIGPAPDVPYSDQLAPRGVHNFFPGFWREDDFFGSGGCGDWGAHHMDIAQWGMDHDGTGPVKVIASEDGRSGSWDRGFRRQRGARLVFADGLEMLHVGNTRWGTVFFGDRGIICVDRGRFAMWAGDASSIRNDKKAREGLSNGTFDGLRKVAYYNGTYSERVNGEERKIDTATPEFGQNMMDSLKKAASFLGVKMCSDRRLGYDLKVKLYKSDSHVKNFVECVRDRKAAISDHNVGPWTSVLCQLVHMSYVHDTGFDWNPAEMTFANGTGNKDWLSRIEVRPDTGRFKVKA